MIRWGIEAYLDTLALRQTDPWLLLSNDEDIGFTSGKGVVNGILDVDDVETTIVALTMGDDTNTSHVTTTGSHGNGTSVELDEVSDLASSQIDLYSVVDLDSRVRVTDPIITQKKICQHFGIISPCSFTRKKLGYRVSTDINQSLVQRLNDAEELTF